MEDNSDDETIPGIANKKPLLGPPVSSDNLAVEVRQKIQDAFRVFDHENNNTVDVREIGTIIRSLGFCPSEAELQEVLRDMEDPQQMGYIQFDRFYPVMSKIITTHRFQLNTSDELLIAFKTLDLKGKGVMNVDDLRRYFTQFGEPFAQDEIDELLNAAVTTNTRDIHYKTFVHNLTLDENASIFK